MGVGFTFDFLKEESSQDVFRESYLPLFIVSPSVSSYPILCTISPSVSSYPILFIVSPSVYPILLCAFWFPFLHPIPLYVVLNINVKEGNLVLMCIWEKEP